MQAWEGFTGGGVVDCYLSDKLKFVKEAFKRWNNSEYEKENKILFDLKKTVNDLDNDAGSRSLSFEEIAKMRDCKSHMLELEKMAKMDLMQKYKIKWLTDEDENSKFFHHSLKVKNKKSCIHGLMINGV